MKKIVSLCIGSFLVLSLFTTGIVAASKGFSFYFNGAYVEGDVNGIFYNIGANKSVSASGSWYLSRSDTIGTQTATCSIALKKSVLGTDTNYGYKSIGSTIISNGYTTGSSENFNISWTSSGSSDRYYLATSCSSASGSTYKVGSGTLYY